MPEPTSERRPDHMHLGVFVQAAGHHVGGWRHAEAQAGGENLKLLQNIAAIAEAGKFDLFFLADGLSTGTDAHPSMITRLEPLTLLGALAMSTSHLGLAATASTTYGEPFHTARVFGTLDHLSGGRAAWNVVTTSYETSASNFTRGAHPPHDERYKIAEEYVDITKGLWDSWDDGAFVMDKASGHFAAPDTMHTLNHEGKYFSVKGPLNLSRPPQGHPVIIQAGSSGPGQNLASRTADIVFTAQQTIEEAQAFYTSVKTRVVGFGRDADAVKIMPGVFPVVGRTRQEARDKFDSLQEWIDPAAAFNLLSQRIGHDVSKFPLDEPLPDLPESEQLQSRSKLLREMARRENLTLRQLLNIVAGARGHRILIGTAEDIADSLEEWFAGRAADGFNIMPPFFPGPFQEFVDLVVPVLQARGLFRHEYEGPTLRDQLGLARPKSRYA